MQLDVRNYSSNTLLPAEGDRYNQLITLSQGGRLQRACEEGRLFAVANQAAKTTTAALASPWAGLGVANPTGSGKILIFHEFGWALSIVGSDDGIVGLMTTTDTGFVAELTPRNRKFGDVASIAIVDTSAAIDTPVLEQICGTVGMGATTTQISVPPQIINLKGGLILVPGRAVCTYTTTVCTSGLLFHFIWEEVDE
jgi:hypothetical protein